MIPVAFVNGIGAAVLWVSQATVITMYAEEYAAANALERAAALGIFNGLFYGIFQFSAIVGNVMTSLLIEQSDESASDDENTVNVNTTLLFVVFFILALVGTAMLVFGKAQTSASTASSSPWEAFKNSVVLLQKREMQLILPMFLFHGVWQAWAAGNFTADIVSESLGSGWIGYVMCLFGFGNVVGSIVFGRLSDRLGRKPIIAFGLLAGLCVQIFFLAWTVTDDAFALSFCFAFAIGLVDSVFNSIPSAFAVAFVSLLLSSPSKNTHCSTGGSDCCDAV